MGVPALTDPGPGGRYLIVGGAGFIGSHIADRLLDDPATGAVAVYDNFSSGRAWHLEPRAGDPRLTVTDADVHDRDRLCAAVDGVDVVVHLAANPDIALAASAPAIDFDEGTALTHGVLEAMRGAGCRRLLYASGSGVYGDRGEAVADEETGPMRPISTYGASKLASEAMISAYCHLFGLRALAFRFANVVGPRQTHGVGLDFIRKLRRDPARLDVLGDGRQDKSYIHVDDAIDAVLAAHARADGPFGVFNVASGDTLTVAAIADMAAACLGLDPGAVDYRYSGGARGWDGDVPVVRLDCGRIRGLGWRCRRGSADAMRLALDAIRDEARLDDS